MVKVEVVVPHKSLAPITEALEDLGYHGLTVTAVSATPEAGTPTQQYRGRRVAPMQAGSRIEVIMPRRRLEEALEMLGRVGGPEATGQILVTPVADVVRIRTGEKGEDAVEG